MKVLWLCNVTLPVIAQHLNISIPFAGGWLAGAASAMSQEPNVKLSVCFPLRNIEELVTGECDGISYYAYPASKKPADVYDPGTESWLKKVVNCARPDLVHIWGTEFPHALAMTRAYDCPEKTIISIQGLCGIYAYHYLAHLEPREYRVFTLRDILRMDWITRQRKKFCLRGAFENEALLHAGHIIGRTRWDHACTRKLSPEAQYHHCNETLRNNFYIHSGEWSAEKCERHSIFVSQAGYPVKGFHLVLEAMVDIVKKYPDAILYTTGPDPFVRPFWRQVGYQKLLRNKIRRLKLRDHVKFLGSLDAEQMCKRFLDSNVFVSASSIENSPNSVGEAMILGVPTVASYVGGTMDLLADKEEGFLYQADAPYMLTDLVCRVFEDLEMASAMGKKASVKAQQIHDPKRNLQTLMSIYLEVCTA